MRNPFIIIFNLISAIFLNGCTKEEHKTYLFSSLALTYSGIDFEHKTAENDSINRIDFQNVLIVGNNYSVETNYERPDAVISINLLGSENGRVHIEKHLRDFMVLKQSKYIISALTKNREKLIIVAQNNKDGIHVYKNANPICSN